MKTNLNPLFENFYQITKKIQINQDYYLKNFLEYYRLECLKALDVSETAYQAYQTIKEVTDVTLNNMDSCEQKAINDGFLTRRMFNYKKSTIIKNLEYLEKIISEQDVNWRLKFMSRLESQNFLFKYI